MRRLNVRKYCKRCNHLTNGINPCCLLDCEIKVFKHNDKVLSIIPIDKYACRQARQIRELGG